jgi:hypothetical protein
VRSHPTHLPTKLIPSRVWPVTGSLVRPMSSDAAPLKPWAVTPEKITEALRRLVDTAPPTRLCEAQP